MNTRNIVIIALCIASASLTTSSFARHVRTESATFEAGRHQEPTPTNTKTTTTQSQLQSNKQTPTAETVQQERTSTCSRFPSECSDNNSNLDD